MGAGYWKNAVREQQHIRFNNDRIQGILYNYFIYVTVYPFLCLYGGGKDSLLYICTGSLKNTGSE